MRTHLENIKKLHLLLFLRIAGPSVLFITFEESTSAVECVFRFFVDACVLAV